MSFALAGLILSVVALAVASAALFSVYRWTGLKSERVTGTRAWPPLRRTWRTPHGAATSTTPDQPARAPETLATPAPNPPPPKPGRN